MMTHSLENNVKFDKQKGVVKELLEQWNNCHVSCRLHVFQTVNLIQHSTCDFEECVVPGF